MTAPTTHDPRLREALKTLAKFEADRLLLLAERERDRQKFEADRRQLLAERERDRQKIDALERKIYGQERIIGSMKMTASRRRARQAEAAG